MIRAYSDHAANERTFLAWVRTGVAIVAFGFVIEKFNLFLLVMASAGNQDIGRHAMFERMSDPLARYDGLAIIVIGLAMILAAAMRFIRPAADCGSRHARRRRVPRRARTVGGFGFGCSGIERVPRLRLVNSAPRFLA